MDTIKRVLFVSFGAKGESEINGESEALRQAINVTHTHDARLTALIVMPKLPKKLLDYRSKFEEHLKSDLQTAFDNTLKHMSEEKQSITIDIQLINDGLPPVVTIVRFLLNNDQDLVIKASDETSTEKGYTAIDTELMRKCPCPLWLTKPIQKQWDQVKVAVAVDPEDDGEQAKNLSLSLFAASITLANSCDKNLTVVSCWDYPFENDIREGAWVKMEEEAVEKILKEEEAEHRTKLEALVKASEVTLNHEIHQIKGPADQKIPEFVQNEDIDILVMGTVARTGLSGFFVGNTAENIMKRVNCSMITLKPSDFVSPITAK